VLNKNTGITECYLGPVSSVIIKNKEAHVVIGETAIPVSRVVRVFDPSCFENTPADEAETSPS
jgi:hypothetical protein